MSTWKSLIKQCLPEQLEIRLQALDHYVSGEPELQLMCRVCEKNRPAIDIGANIGTYTFLLRRHASKVIAYEPNPGLSARLKRIFPDVDVRAKAVSDRPGRLELRIPMSEGRELHELGSIVQDFSDATEFVSHDVPVVSIDGDDLDDAGFIKIDVEQNEIAVLTGALETIKRCRPVIMSEVTPLLYDGDLSHTFAFLTDLDYEGWFRFQTKWLPFSDFVAARHANSDKFGSDQFMAGNVFFIPAGIDGTALLAR